MIRFENVSKEFVMDGRRKVIMKNVDMVFPSGRSVGLLGRNGAGKSTLLQMIAGTMPPSEGRILTTGSVSWPVGFAGSFHGELSGAQNCRFIGRIYGVDTDELIDFVQEFAGIGQHFHLPLRTYSSGMRSRLAFGVSMGVAFDTYLIDEITAVGDAEFKRRSDMLLKERMKYAGAVVVSHAMPQIRDLCDAAVVLEDGTLRYYDDVDEGIARHEHNMTKSMS